MELKRKVIKQGNNTLTITLPRNWTKNLGVKAGDEIELQEKDSSLIIARQEDISKKKADVKFTKEDKRYIRSHIGRLYRYGYSYINARFNDNSTYREIENAVNSLIGADIVESSEKSCLIKIYPVHEEDVSIEQNFIKIFNTLKYANSLISDDIINSSFKRENELKTLRDNNWKIKDFILRIIYMKHASYEEHSVLNHMLFAYEKILTHLLKVYRIYLSNQKKINNPEKHKELFEKINKFYDEFIHLFNKKNPLTVAEETALRKKIRALEEEFYCKKNKKLNNSIITALIVILELLDSTVSFVAVYKKKFED